MTRGHLNASSTFSYAAPAYVPNPKAQPDLRGATLLEALDEWMGVRMSFFHNNLLLQHRDIPLYYDALRVHCPYYVCEACRVPSTTPLRWVCCCAPVRIGGHRADGLLDSQERAL